MHLRSVMRSDKRFAILGPLGPARRASETRSFLILRSKFSLPLPHSRKAAPQAAEASSSTMSARSNRSGLPAALNSEQSRCSKDIDRVAFSWTNTGNEWCTTPSRPRGLNGVGRVETAHSSGPAFSPFGFCIQPDSRQGRATTGRFRLCMGFYARLDANARRRETVPHPANCMSDAADD